MWGLGGNLILMKGQFFIFFVGVNSVFFPQHFLGLRGMPRRYIDYWDGYIGFNSISSFGALMSGLGAMIGVFMLFEQAVIGRKLLFSNCFSKE